jgi:hypothetical protein
MSNSLKERQQAALDRALKTGHVSQLDALLEQLRALGFATKSKEIPAPARGGGSIKDYFGVRKGSLRPVALLPRELWADNRSPGTRGNAVWLCVCEECGALVALPSLALRPRSLWRSCGCLKRRARGASTV